MDVETIKKHIFPLCIKSARNILEDPEDLFQDIVMGLFDYDEIPLMKYRAKQMLTDIYRKSTIRKMESLSFISTDGEEIKTSYEDMRSYGVNSDKLDELNVIMNSACLEPHEKELLYQRFYLGWSLLEIGDYENRGKSTICTRLQDVIRKIRVSIV